MARPRYKRRRILVASLLLPQNSTPAVGAEQGGATGGCVAYGREVTGEPVSRRTRSRLRAAAALGRLPEEIVVWEILVRLPARDILRCRVVCRSWRRLASAPDFLLAHHRRQPQLPLVVARAGTSTGDDLPILEHGLSRPVLGFDDHDYYLYGRFKLHASCDGLLLLSRSDDGFSICNPATRQCAQLPHLTAEGRGNIKIVALYLHRPSGEYRILYWKCKLHVKAPDFFILTVGCRGLPRCIGVPWDTPAIQKALMAKNGVSPIDVAGPVAFAGCLHWEPGWHNNDDIIVFDTMVESFRSMCCPLGAASGYARLSDMEGSIGFSCLDDRRTAARIWVLEDYEREVWSFKYHVKFPVESLCCHTDTHDFIYSHQGDMLVYSTCGHYYMFQCDSTGNLLKELKWKPESHGLDVIGHGLKESLVQHDFFTKRGATCDEQPSFFQNL